MKNICRLLLFAALLPATARAQQGHSITVQVNDYADTLLYLGNYFGQQTYLLDSAQTDGRGTAVFKGPDPLPGGIYFILLPGKARYFEFLVDKQQHFGITADTAGHFKQVSFRQSPLNDLFYQYNRYLADQQQQLDSLRAAGADSAILQESRQQTGEEIRDYRERFIKEHPATLLAAIFRSMKDPEVPAGPPPGEKKDTAFAYHYFKNHYWDGIDFSDSRILRTPVLETRLRRYFSQLVVPVADSINKEADAIIQKSKADREVFKFVLWWLTHTYETSPYMGMDAVFVHLVEKYYMTGQAYWLSKEQTQKVIDRASQIAPNLIGNMAPDLELTGVDNQPVSLRKIQADYTILVFWDPTCGHCQVEVPQLDSAFEARWKREGVKMVGVLAGGTQDEWKKFIADHQLEDWINAWDPQNDTNYRRLYDVYSTPVVYLLDKNKKILAKRLGIQELDDFLQHLLKM